MFKFSFHLEFPYPWRQGGLATCASKHKLATFVDEVCAERKSTLGYSTLQNYLTATRSICQYAGTGLAIEQVDSDLIAGYQSWLRHRNVGMNTVACYMRTLRTIYNHAVDSLGIADKKPFARVFTGKLKTEKRAISIADVKAVAALHLADCSPLSLSRDMFLFSVYAMGMPFVDMAFLRRSQISDGSFVYHRHKTHQRISVGIEPCMALIMGKYARESTSDYVFPVLSGDTTRVDALYAAKLARYNRHLRKLARLAGVAPLTSYVARHTWASLAYSSNVDLNVISKGMGHTNTHTTLVYIKEINDSRLTIANANIIRQLT